MKMFQNPKIEREAIKKTQVEATVEMKNLGTRTETTDTSITSKKT